MSDETDIEALRKAYVSEVTEIRKARPKARTPKQVIGARSPELSQDDLEALLVDAETFESAMRMLLDILADQTSTPDLQLTALERLGAATFQPVRFAPFHAEYIERLRELALSPDKDVRHMALDRLTLENDEVGQQLLREGLEGTRKPLLPAATAARFLARDEHGDAAPLFRELAQSSTGRVREEALRALAADPESVELLASISSDKSERTAVRELAAMSLKAQSPTRFADVARGLVLDDDEDDHLRTTALSAVAFTPEAAAAVDDPDFRAGLDRVKDATTSRSLKTSIDRFAQARPDEPEK
ncbi:HEAT repeat domain-containing protein [Microbacterium sp. B2969]|uniref:HEAT repeat domain-containing protein n=1 Tax=Microbacterium alkaliflavum TaxID=3248839 RepID=A0ABW7QDW2_9MICO